MSADQPDDGPLGLMKRFFPQLEITWQVLLVVILTPVLLVLACALCGYWNTLGIDVFSYLTFSSLLLDGFLGSLPVVASLGSFTLLSTLGALMLFNALAGGRSVSSLRWEIVGLVVIYGGGVVIALGHCGITPLSLSALGITTILVYTVSQGVSKNREIRGFALVCSLLLPSIVALPLLAYVHGVKRAEDYLRTPLAFAMLGGDPGGGPLNILGPVANPTGRLFPEPYLPVVNVQTEKLALEKQYFLGRIGDHLFFLDPATLKREAIAEKDITRFTILNIVNRPTFAMPFGKASKPDNH